MAKFKLKMKLQGFELEVEGSREDVPLITQSMAEQFAGLLQPMTAIVEGSSQVSDVVDNSPVSLLEQESSIRKKSKRKRTSPQRSDSAAVGDGNIINWRHDPAKYGSPQQKWKTSDKAIWLLYVAGEESNEKELSTAQISATFNKHFRQAKIIQSSNVSRDLGKLKVSQNAPVAEDTTLNPAKWYLTDEGVKLAAALVAKAVGGGDE